MKLAMFRTQYLVFLIIILQHISFCMCHIPNFSMARILKGKRADLKDFPHATIFFNDRSMCGANIITSRTMITAAHCFDTNTEVTLMVCAIGNTGDKALQKGVKTVVVWDYIIHSQYDNVNFHNDIAALFMENPIPLSVTAQRALIVDTDEFIDEKDKIFMASGWGWTKYPNGSISHDGLQTVSLEFVEKHKCMTMTGIEFGDDAFCLDAGSQDTCVGDSGSGIMWRGMMVGLVSCGDGCGNPDSAGLYTNLFTLMNWLEDAIEDFHNRLCEFIEKTKGNEIAG